MSEPGAGRDLTPLGSLVARAEREALLGQSGCTLWFTGLSGAGKSTIAQALERRLVDQGRASALLDGDTLRDGLCRDLGFSPADRSENVRRVAEVARLMSDAGLIVLVALIAPLRSDRARAREIVGTDRFVEVFVSTPLEECRRRDPKQLYARAAAGEIAEFTGVSAPYEAPEAPELTLDTSQLEVSQAVALLLEALPKRRRQ